MTAAAKALAAVKNAIPFLDDEVIASIQSSFIVVVVVLYCFVAAISRFSLFVVIKMMSILYKGSLGQEVLRLIWR